MSAAIDPELAAIEGGLATYVSARRWFRGKSRAMQRCTVADAIPIPLDADRAWVVVVRARYADGIEEDYALPLLLVDRARADALRKARPHLIVAERPEGGAVVDALGDDRFLRSLLPSFARGAVYRHGESVVRFRVVGAEGDTEGRAALGQPAAAPRPIDAEQSNTSIVFGDAYVLKLIRKLDEGVSADLEMGEFLTGAGYANAPHVAGAVEILRGSGEPATLAILHRFVPNRGDAWAFFLERLTRRLSEGASAGAVLGDDTSHLHLLGTRVAEMHVALASRPDLPAFAPEPLGNGERARLAETVGASMREVLDALASRTTELPADVTGPIARIHARRADLEARLSRFGSRDVAAEKTRVHGDLHLGQILVAPEDLVLIDFEGEPARSLAERKAKRSPLVDVAGVLRSLHYASVAAARATPTPSPDTDRAAQAWHDAARDIFLDAYFLGVKGATFLPPQREDARRILDFYLLEKCVYEVHYELNNRPAWLAIPVAGLVQLLERPDAP